MALIRRCLDWLLSEDRRKKLRHTSLPLVAYFWDGAVPVAHPVRDASSTGLYLLTDHRWYLGTVVALTLQRTAADDDDPARAISVNARVVRTGDDGVGLEFLLPETQHKRTDLAISTSLIDTRRLQQFLAQVQTEKAAT